MKRLLKWCYLKFDFRASYFCPNSAKCELTPLQILCPHSTALSAFQPRCADGDAVMRSTISMLGMRQQE